MKKYNSLFTIALSIDHDKKDASDITMEEIIEAMNRSVKDIEYDCPIHSFDTGPESTIENQD